MQMVDRSRLASASTLGGRYPYGTLCIVYIACGPSTGRWCWQDIVDERRTCFTRRSSRLNVSITDGVVFIYIISFFVYAVLLLLDHAIAYSLLRWIRQLDVIRRLSSRFVWYLWKYVWKLKEADRSLSVGMIDIFLHFERGVELRTKHLTTLT